MAVISSVKRAASVRPALNRSCRYGLNRSSRLPRLPALASSSSTVSARANRCTVLRSNRKVRQIAEIDLPSTSRCCTAAYRSRVRVTRRLSTGVLSADVLSLDGVGGVGLGFRFGEIAPIGDYGLLDRFGEVVP